MKTRIHRLVPGVALLALLAPAAAAAQHAPIWTDSVLFAGDLNANGKREYVVLESKAGTFAEVRASRVAVYLDSRPETRRPAWATPWDDADEFERSIDPPRTLSPGVSIIEVIESGGDWAGETMLLVQPGGLRKEISFGVDYGNGQMEVHQVKNGVYVVATDAHLALRGKAVEAHHACKRSEWSAVRLDYDFTHTRFVVGRDLCVPMQGATSR